jgi:hypothetical protein
MLLHRLQAHQEFTVVRQLHARCLQAGASAFLPYLNHLVGQASSRRSSSGYDSGSGQAASSGSGIIGCLAAKDWAVRRAAADAIRAAVLLLGPALEPEGRWQLGDPSSLTQRCMSALDSQSCKFDKVCTLQRGVCGTCDADTSA